MKGSAVVVVLSCVLVAVSGFRTGAPAPACVTLSPDPSMHGAQPQNESLLPYQLNISLFDPRPDGSGGYGYIPGRSYTFSLRIRDDAPANTMFRGLLVRAVQYMDMTTFVGTFTPVSPTTKLSLCTPMNTGITHTNGSDKTTVYMTFNAPPVNTGPIELAYAVVQVQNTYWADLRSMPLIELDVPVTDDDRDGAVTLAAGSVLCLASAIVAVLL